MTYRLPSLFALLTFVTSAEAMVPLPQTRVYAGDALPSAGDYADWFTTIGPGAPNSASWFHGTTWSSDGDVLTMTTQHPNSFNGATSQGIWFGRADGYGDDPDFSFASNAAGNRIDLRMALGFNSSEWSLYWGDGSGYGASLYLLTNGFNYTLRDTQTGPTQTYFHAVADMTTFHTFSTHVYDEQVTYFLDGAAVASGWAQPHASNFMLLGDGSARDVTGYGTLRIDSLAITINAGAIPEPATMALWLGVGVLGGAAGWRRRRRAAGRR